MRKRNVIGNGFKLLLAALLLAVLFGMTSMAAGSVAVNVKMVKEGLYVLKKPCEILVTGNCMYT